MAENNFGSTMESLFKGMDGFITSKTVVGEAIHFEDGTLILPLVDVTFGAGAGAFSRGNKENDKKDSGVGALTGKITPSSVLVIKNGEVKLVNIKNQDTVTKLLDMVPDLVNKFAPGKKGQAGKEAEMTEEDIAKKLDEEGKE